jgi:hypothetical protein
MTVIFKEKMKIPANVVDELITGVGSDIRQVLNMLSTWKLHNDTMDYEEGKMLCAGNLFWLSLTDVCRSAKANEKYAVMTPFNIIQKILGPYMFSATSRDTLNDKIELYFHDYSFVPLFIQVGTSGFRRSVYSFVPTGELSENESIARTRHRRIEKGSEAIEAYGEGVRVDIRWRPCRQSHSWVHAVAHFPVSSF